MIFDRFLKVLSGRGPVLRPAGALPGGPGESLGRSGRLQESPEDFREAPGSSEEALEAQMKAWERELQETGDGEGRILGPPHLQFSKKAVHSAQNTENQLSPQEFGKE